VSVCAYLTYILKVFISPFFLLMFFQKAKHKNPETRMQFGNERNYQLLMNAQDKDAFMQTRSS